MSTRIISQNRTIFANARVRSYSTIASAAVPTDKRKSKDAGINVNKNTQTIPVWSPESPFRDGYAWRCPDDQVNYRIVKKINIQEGWGTAAFWMERYGVTTFNYVREWVERGWLDAALQEGSPTKRYRCRDERKIYEAMCILHAKKNSIGPGEKTIMRFALAKLKPLFDE
jgi:hypothetical protein